MRHFRPATWGVGLLLTLLTLSCSDAATLANPDLTGAYNLVRVSGDAQQGAGGSQLPSELVVRLLDRAGSGVAGIRVAFSVVSGGGVVAPAAVATDRDGYARTTWTLGTAASEQQVQASVSGVAPLAFTANANVVTPEQLARAVAVTPAQYMFSAVGDSLHLTAVVSDSTGRPLPGARLRWTSLDPAAATVDSTGTVVSRANGHARITAMVGSVGAAAGMHVQQVVTGVSMGASADTLNLVGDTLRLSAIPVDRRGNPVPQVSQTWVSLDPTVATVDSAGLVVATGVGKTSVRAVASSQYGTATVTVRGRKTSAVASVSVAPSSASITGIGATTQLTAHAYDANGVELSGQQFKWGAGDPSVASVDGSGKVTSKRAGTTQIMAVAGGVSGSASLTIVVPAGSVAKVVVSPSTPTIDGLGSTAQLTATAYDGNNNTLAGQTFTWASGNAAVATVNGNGLATAAAVGTAPITATTAGVQGSASLTVMQTSVAVARLTINPSSVQLTGVGSTVRLSAQAYDASGTPLSAPIAWSSANTAVATVDSTGLVTARGAGSVQVTASSGGAQAAAAITVTLPVARVAVTPATNSLTSVGATAQLSAQAYDGSGTAMSGQVYTWASSNSAVATVSSTGLVSATGAGSATITATDAGVQGSASVTVTVSSGTSAGDPLPSSSDAVLLDTRAGGAQNMQNAATWSDAIAASTLVDENGDHTSGATINGYTVHKWEWAPNFDGKGTHAFQGNITATGCGDLGGYTLYKTLPSSYKNITIQYKFWLSKNPNDTSHTALGSPGSWTVVPNPACYPFTSTHGQHKRLLIGRTPTNTRADLIFTNGGDPRYPTAISIEGWYFSGAESDHYVNWVPELHVNQVNTITFQVQAESYSGAHDGVIRLWVNGQLLFQSTTASVSTDYFYRFLVPSTVSDPSQYQTEYIWDVVAWTNSGSIR